MATINLFLVDDHKLFLEGLISILNEKPGLKVIGYACSASEYFSMADEVQPDVILVDVNMPEMSGIELTHLIKENNPQAKILALTMYEDPIYIQKMVHSGVNGYILKSANIKELETAIRMVSKGENYLAQDIQKIVMDKIGYIESFEDFDSFNKNKLSKREIQIVSLIAREFSTQEIAEKLHISERTVETHRKNILAKTNAKSIVGLVKYAIREGLVYY